MTSYFFQFKDFRKLVAVGGLGAGGLRPTVFWAQHIDGGAHLSLSLLASLIRIRYPFTAGLTRRVFQISDS